MILLILYKLMPNKTGGIHDNTNKGRNGESAKGEFHFGWGGGSGPARKKSSTVQARNENRRLLLSPHHLGLQYRMLSLHLLSIDFHVRSFKRIDSAPSRWVLR